MEPKRARACAKRKGSSIFQLHIENNSSLESWKHGRNQEPPLLELKQWTDGGNPLTVSFLRRWTTKTGPKVVWIKNWFCICMPLFGDTTYQSPPTWSLTSANWSEWKRNAPRRLILPGWHKLMKFTGRNARHKWDQVKYQHVTLFEPEAVLLLAILRHHLGLSWFIIIFPIKWWVFAYAPFPVQPNSSMVHYIYIHPNYPILSLLEKGNTKGR